MSERSLQASQKGINEAKRALTNSQLTQKALAQRIGVTRQPIGKFFRGKPVDRNLFVEICQTLNLDWEEVAEPPNEPEARVVQDAAIDIDALVQEVREKVKSSIQERCGKMRVLDMEQPIGLSDIYTDVNVLKKITGRRRLNLSELLQAFDPEKEDFNRCGLGQTQERVPGLDAVNRYPKLMVLGKPGAGKTTFLKYLAIQCICAEFQSNRVPLFITLKQFAENSEKPSLLEFINHEFTKESITSTSISEFINQGRALVLLDGLDEVREEDSDRVLQEIKKFSTQYHTNQFLITCRIAAREYTLEQFVEVEVADFNDEQIKTFVNKWFGKEELEVAERFVQELKSNQPIKELATNPLLLTLLCLEFEDSGDFPSDRAELYNRAIHTLLRKWDSKRGIKRDEIYKKLSVRHKEDLLSDVAWTTFKRKDYFFKQRDIERYISDYIRNLPEAKTDSEALRLDSEAVLKSIEAQHGLLVERARGIYSFSHLTFQEYFTAKKIVDSPALQTLEQLKILANHITEKRWREVFLLAVGMVYDAGDLLLSMKDKTDELVASDEKIQEFLSWLNQKSLSIEVAYKPAAVRAFYLISALDRAYVRVLDRNYLFNRVLLLDSVRAHVRAHVRVLDNALTLASRLASARDLDSARVLDSALDSALDLTSALDSALTRDLDSALDLDNALTLASRLASSLAHASADDLANDLDSTFTLANVLARSLDSALGSALEAELQQLLQELKAQLPNLKHSEESQEIYLQWCQVNAQNWIQRLNTVMIEQRNIGHDWQFTKSQWELLSQYYYANKLLINCLNSDCRISPEVRQEIEDTLLLPIDIIRK